MRVLFDQGVPAPLRSFLAGHTVATAFERGWAGLSNGELLKSAEVEFDVLVTTDQSLRYQQNLAGRRLAIVVLPTTSWPKIQAHAREVVDTIGAVRPGDYREITFGTQPD